MGVTEAIAETFAKCASTSVISGVPLITDFSAVVKVLWPVLDNNVSLCDLSGIFTIASPSRGDAGLDIKLFAEFLGALAKIKYTNGTNGMERLMREIVSAKSVHFGSDNALFAKLIDRHVIRVLLKFDLPLRRAFSAFAGGEGVARVGGALNWDEVKTQNIGMEIQGFVNFASTYSMIPSLLSSQQSVLLAKDVISRFPLLASETSPNMLLYPQFQLLLALAAATISISSRAASSSRLIASSSTGSMPAPSLATPSNKTKAVSTSAVQDPKLLAEGLSDLLKSIGVNIVPNHAATKEYKENTQASSNPRGGRRSADADGDAEGDNYPWSTVAMPNTDQPKDLYRAMEHPGGELAQLRMQHLFSEMATELQLERGRKGEYFASNSFSRTFSAMDREREALGRQESACNGGGYSDDDFFAQLPLIMWETDPSIPVPDDPHLKDGKSSLAIKPIVMGDAVPPPIDCPLSVLHFLEAALAHHNLGSYEEALKFLEAARSTYIELLAMEREDEERRALKSKARKAAKEGTDSGNTGSSGNKIESIENNIAVDPTLGINIPGTPMTSNVFETQHSNVIAPSANGKYNIPLDIDLYITVCMGNIYQSSGDDEQALLQYLKGWREAREAEDRDWAVVCLNCIGLVAYYNLRYELAYQCFLTVADYRAKEYGLRSVDTASAWNNEGCALFGMYRYTDARLIFERALSVMESVLGSRHPRTGVMQSNVEKAKRSLGIKMNIKNIKESIAIRPDAERLLIGSRYIIHALPPPEKKKGTGKKNGKKKKKK